MKHKHKGFGPEPQPKKKSANEIEQALNELSKQLSADFMDESTSASVRGEVDAFFGNPCSSADPSYREAYSKARMHNSQLPPDAAKFHKDAITHYKEFFSAIDVEKTEASDQA